VRLLRGALEFLFITGLICTGIMLAPVILVRWAFEPRTWREPKDVGLGFYEHP